MRHLFIFILIHFSIISYSNTVGVTKVTIGKINISFITNKKEDNFKFVCIGQICDYYLHKTCNRLKYTLLPKTDLMLKYSNQEKIQIGLKNNKIQITLYSTSGLTEKTLKLINYSISNYHNLKKISIHAKNIKETNSLIDFNTISEILNKELDLEMKKCLRLTFYRNKYHINPTLKCDKFDEVYTFRNDTFFISCDNKCILKLQNIEYALISYELGFLIFDSDSSFYHFNPSDYYKLRNCGILSQRHQIKGIKNIIPNYEIDDVDLINNRLFFNYDTYDSNKDSFLAKNYESKFIYKRKFIFLITEDILISDFQVLEQNLINEYKMNNR